MPEQSIILKDIPFHPNDEKGMQCAQVCVKIALEYFFKKQYSLDELDKITHRQEKYWTWNPQIVTAMDELGLDVMLYTADPIEPFLNGEKGIRETFPTQCGTILKHTDIPVLIQSTQQLIDNGRYTLHTMTIGEIEDHIRQGHIVMTLIDYSVLYHIEKPFQGHLVVIVGFDDAHIYYHESGPENPAPFKKVFKKDFVAALNAEGTGHDTIIVKGPKSG